MAEGSYCPDNKQSLLSTEKEELASLRTAAMGYASLNTFKKIWAEAGRAALGGALPTGRAGGSVLVLGRGKLQPEAGDSESGARMIT